MIQVTLQILNAHFTSGNYPPRSYLYVYEIRSFWSKVVQIPATDGSGKTVPVSLPGLTTDDYERKKTHGEDVMICIEVYAEPLAAEYLSRENKKRVGVAMLPISYAIARPHVNPLWESVSVNNIIRNSEEGKLYVKVDTKFIPTPGRTPVENGPDNSPYFSTSNKSDPALRCPAHVIDQVRNGPASNNFMDVSEENKKLLAKLDQDPEEVKAGIRWAETTPDAKKNQRIRHNIITSPDFPFQIPAVEAAEKMLMTQYNAKTNHQAHKNQNVPCSPPLFTFTPYIDKQWSSTNSAASSPSKGGNHTTTGKLKKSQLTSSIDDLVTALNTPAAATAISKKETAEREQKNQKQPEKDVPVKNGSSKKTLVRQSSIKSDMKKRMEEVPAKPKQVSKNSATKDSNSDNRLVLSPKPDKVKAKPRKSDQPIIPGLTIKEYKAPEDNSVHTPFPRSRRIAANIFQD